jgi:cell division protein FtsN
MQDMGKLKEKVELSLDSRQIFFLLFGGAAIACLVFVLGVMVGKRLEARDGSHAPRCGAELEALDRLSDETEDLTFHKVLVKKGVNPNLPPEVYETSHIDEPGWNPRAAAARARRQIQRAGGRKQATADSRRTSAGQKNEPAPARRARRHEKKARLAGKKPQRKAAHARKTARAAAKKVRRFTLQVSSFKKRTQAETMVNRLESKGLSPYLISSHIPRRGMWYRVRMGNFTSWAEAVAAKKKFEKKWKMTAYVMRRH